ncbi:MAG: Rpn family recombination-promoting nuclease/putative transposase [Methylobacteriaceae bacterium]|jgi:predicted transposase/invertase (TIGR01784 family)|nr:Rpn family recombination-promoting nuclease/putative transposase [Methylobacteriaceae bacterium]
MPHLVDLLPAKSHVIFQFLFGPEENRDIFKAFLKAVLDMPAEEFAAFKRIKPHRFPAEDGPTLVFEITRPSGQMIYLEIMSCPITDMRENFMNFTLRASRQRPNESGKLPKCIFIGINDIDMFPENKDYHQCFRLENPKNATSLTDLFEIHTLELTKLPPEDDGTPLWSWAKLLTLRELWVDDDGEISKDHPLF